MIFKFTLQGEMPSKKNSWKPGLNGRMYIPEGVKCDIDAFLWQLKAKVKRYGKSLPTPLPTRITAVFKTADNKDLDNKLTTLLDILQKAKVITNDKNVIAISCTKEKSPHPLVAVVVESIE